MWCYFWKVLIFLIYCNGISGLMPSQLAQMALDQDAITVDNYVFWPNATVPFYIHREHYDNEQALSILTALSMFAFKTCLKFAPVMAPPMGDEHVLAFENPNGIRRCVLDTAGHSVYGPHRVVIGYDCMHSPSIEMMIMRSLGFPFEHNKPSRGIYIDVIPENIEPGAIDLFTKDNAQPLELSALPFDINSVMHFGDRDYSKNGHRTILFKDPNANQNRKSLTNMDLRKIDIVYGPQCRTRDRQEKLDLCQSYPGVARRKRDVLDDEEDSGVARMKRDVVIAEEKDKKDSPVTTESVKTVAGVSGGASKASDQKTKEKTEITIDVTQSLRINPHITPPPEQLKALYTELGIEDGLQDLIEKIFAITKTALNKVKEKHCNVTIPKRRSEKTDNTKTKIEEANIDIAGIVEIVANYVNAIVGEAKQNLTVFCTDPSSEDFFVRQGYPCMSVDNCPKSYFSTKSGPVMYSTKHWPTFYASTKNVMERKHVFESRWRRRRSVSYNEDVTEKLQREDKTAESVGDNKKQVENVETDTKSKATESVKVVSNEFTKDDKKENIKDVKKENITNDNRDNKGQQKAETPLVASRRRGVIYRKREISDTSDEIPDIKTLTKAKKYSSEDQDDRDFSKELKRIETEKYEELQKKSQVEVNNQRDIEIEKQFEKHLLSEGDKSIEQKRETTKHRFETKNNNVKKNKHKNSNVQKMDKARKKPKSFEEKYLKNAVSNKEEKKSKNSYNHSSEPAAPSMEIDYKQESRLKKKQKDSSLETLDRKEIKLEHKRFKPLKGDNVNTSEDLPVKHKTTKKDNKTKHKNPRTKNKSSSEELTEEKTNKENKSERTEQSSGEGETENSNQSSKEVSSKEVNRDIPRMVKLSKANEEFYKDRRWPKGEVRYVIQEDTTYNTEDMRTRIEEINDILKENTCVRLTELDGAQTQEYEDYLIIDNSPDYVTGRVGGKQRFGSLELFRGGQHRQHTAMMVMAWLGFYFEVSRHDRDKYIRVHQRHVRPDKLHHFEKIREDATLDLPYDYNSATHPAWQYWRQLGRKGISTVATYKHMDPDGKIMKSLGQHNKLLSDIDIAKINSVYGLDCKRKDKGKSDEEKKNKRRRNKKKKDTSSSSSSSGTSDSESLGF